MLKQRKDMLKHTESWRERNENENSKQEGGKNKHDETEREREREKVGEDREREMSGRAIEKGEKERDILRETGGTQ